MAGKSRALRKKRAMQNMVTVPKLDNDNPFEQVFDFLPLLSIILSFISDNIYTDTQNAMKYFLYHQLKSEKEYYIIKKMKKLFTDMCYSRFRTYLINNYHSEITQDMINKFPNKTTFFELCHGVKVSRTLLFQLSNKSTNSFLDIGRHICKQVIEIFLKIWPYDLIPDSRKAICCDIEGHTRSTTKENIDYWCWSGYESDMPGCSIIYLNFLKLCRDDQVDYFLHKITNTHKKPHWWVHINRKRCGSYYCACKDNIFL